LTSIKLVVFCFSHRRFRPTGGVKGHHMRLGDENVATQNSLHLDTLPHFQIENSTQL